MTAKFLRSYKEQNYKYCFTVWKR